MLTIVLATRKRAASLRRVLTRYGELQSPEGGWKLIVVDNGSSHDTPSVVKDFALRLPITYLHLAEPGQNRAQCGDPATRGGIGDLRR